MPTSNLDYTSFLIRLWREPQPDIEGRTTGGEWLVQTEHIPSGEKRYFPSLEACFLYIRARSNNSAPKSNNV